MSHLGWHSRYGTSVYVPVHIVGLVLGVQFIDPVLVGLDVLQVEAQVVQIPLCWLAMVTNC